MFEAVHGSAPRKIEAGEGDYANPESILKAAEMLGLAPADCLVAEDARAGVEAAVAGGFDCAAIGDARDDERARWHLNRFSDILKSLG